MKSTISLLSLMVLSLSSCSKDCIEPPKLLEANCGSYNLKYRTGKYEVMIRKSEFIQFAKYCKRMKAKCEFLNKQIKEYNDEYNSKNK